MRGIKGLVLIVCIFFLFNITEKLNYFPVINTVNSAFILKPISVTDNRGVYCLCCQFHAIFIPTLTVY